ncbi:MAG: 4-hydroxy-tetrahydrodipicolinate reductase [Defluviitaleaceae bacterium]|nr:4-hydroxy-tetrahydrodipicolinate reductase [Defluviitaleaceae bacterium]
MVKMIVHGCAGRLGSLICESAKQEEGFSVAAGVDNRNLPNDCNFPIFQEISDCRDIDVDIIIDCSTAAAVDAAVDFALKKNIPIVICTTAISETTLENIKAAAEKIPVFVSANMSLGVYVLSQLVKNAAKSLGNHNFDIKIIEAHHKNKIDAPSGTALALADAMGLSENSEIYSIRAGTIVGNHKVVFAGNNEIIEISHQALSREVFAQGALRAARFLDSCKKNPGIYGMQDMLSAAENSKT